MRRSLRQNAASSALFFIALIIAPTVGAEVGPDEALPTDPRVIEANALMSDEANYDRVVALYRSVLADDPDDLEARLWLARVLSWQGDTNASVEEYDRLLARPDAQPELEIERAEVLSWGGRYEDAETSFEAILAEAPNQARAARGLARVYLWSGRRDDAIRAFEHALTLDQDTEAQRELDALASGLGSDGDLGTRHFRDSDGFELTSVTAAGTFDLSYDTQILLSGTYTRIDRDALLPADGRIGANGFDVYGGLAHYLRPELQIRGELGFRIWDEADDHFLARGAVEWSLPSNTALGAEIEHGDFLSRTDSFNAVFAGLDATSLRGTVWQGLSRGFSVFYYLDTTFVSDDNTRVATGLNGAWRPLADYELELGVALSVLSYTERSLLYYDPDVDFGMSASARGFYAIPGAEWLGFEAEVRLGFGYTEQGGVDGVGFTYSVGGGPKIQHDRFWIAILGARSQSRRATNYTTHSVSAALGIEF